jgi:hypothetical protein
MNSTARFAISLLLGVVIGLGSARYLAGPSNPLIREAHGQWFTWPSAGHPDSSPYSQSKYLLAGVLPEHFSETVTFFRQHDDAGGRLSSQCNYVVSMARPAARRWAVSLAAPDSAPTSVLTQNDVIANNDRIEISISGYPQSGNWLGSNGLDEPYLFFRLYDAETILNGGNDTFELPAVKLETCS